MVLTGIMQKDILVNKHKYKKNNLALFPFFFPKPTGPASLVAFYGSFSNCLKPLVSDFFPIADTLEEAAGFSTDCFSQRLRLPDTSPGLKS